VPACGIAAFGSVGGTGADCTGATALSTTGAASAGAAVASAFLPVKINDGTTGAGLGFSADLGETVFAKCGGGTMGISTGHGANATVFVVSLPRSPRKTVTIGIFAFFCCRKFVL